MKHKILIPFLLIFLVSMLNAQDISKQHFQQAYQEISSMLEGKQPLDFEKVVFLTENAYRDNAISHADFKAALDVHSAIIELLFKTNDKYDWKQFVRGNMGIAPDMEIEAKERYRKALANWAIFTYLTDTLTVKLEGQDFLHMPYTYSNDDPFGTVNWKNSQTMNLLETQRGNCYSLVTLFKIFSERFKSEANIVTAPEHIYIEHRDPKGSRFNVEVATRSFPDMGSIQTLTYTTREALLNDISMRKLDLKQSVGLSLVYLAKGYEYKNKVKDDEFILACANTALQHDPKNLNALLLKAQVYEQRVIKKEMPSAPYEKMLAEFYKLGYRQMPDDMKNIILSKIQGTPSTVAPANKTPNPFENIGEQARYVTLSNGLFEELHTPKKIVRYGQTIFDTEKDKIVKFLNEDNSSYQVDPVVFALSVDPLTKSYPWYTPYQFTGNSPILFIDLDGLERAPNIFMGYDVSAGKLRDNADGKAIAGYKKGDPKFGKAVLQIASFTDIDDATVLISAIITLGQNPIHTTGETATSDDIEAAKAGILLPVFSGGGTKKTYDIASEGIANGLEFGEFLIKNHYMSDIAKQYQKQVNGIAGEVDFLLKGEKVHFDGFKDGVLLEAKGLGYKKFLTNEKLVDKVLDNLLGQAERQIKAANGKPIEWHFAEKESADIFRDALRKSDLEGIEVKHTPIEFKKNGSK